MVLLKCNVVLCKHKQLKNELSKGHGTRFACECSSQDTSERKVMGLIFPLFDVASA